MSMQLHLIVFIALAAAAALAAPRKSAPQSPRSQTPDIGRPTRSDDSTPDARLRAILFRPMQL
jgi:hypothetical protein